MSTDFSEKTESMLIAERSALLAAPQVDAEALRLLEDEATARLTLFLSGDADIDTDDAPMFFSFIKVFGETENTELKMLAKRAEAKITPVLKEFDKNAGFDKATAEDLERNVVDLETFERLNPFERADDGKLLYAQFEKVERVLKNVEIEEDDGTVSAEATETFMETVLEAARIKAYMRLCIADHEITQEEYLDTVQFEMEKALVILFVMDKTAGIEFPLDGAEAEKIHNEFKKLIDAI